MTKHEKRFMAFLGIALVFCILVLMYIVNGTIEMITQ